MGVEVEMGVGVGVAWDVVRVGGTRWVPFNLVMRWRAGVCVSWWTYRSAERLRRRISGGVDEACSDRMNSH